MGSKYHCSNCSHPVAQEFFDAAMRAICPNCYVSLQLVKTVESLPGLTEQDKAILNIVAALAVGVFIGKFLVG